MVKVEFNVDEEKMKLTMRVKGHAGQNNVGYDIVCSAVSILTYTLAQTMKNMFEGHQLKKKPILKLEIGDGEISVQAKKESYAETLHSFYVVEVGFILLANQYPQYIQLTRFDEADKPIK